MATSDSLPNPVVTPYTTSRSRTMRSTWWCARSIRSRASPASETARPPRATASTSAIVSDRPSRMTEEFMARNVGKDSYLGKLTADSRWLLLKSPGRSSVASPVVIELQIRLRAQRDEEVEREVAVRRLGEREDRVPVVQLPTQRHGVHSKLVSHEIIVGRPLHRPLRRYAEASRSLNVLRRRTLIHLAAPRRGSVRILHAGRRRVLLY